jgi:hypothetical protein
MRDFVGPLIALGIGAAIAVALAFVPNHGPLYEWQSDGGYSGVGLNAKPGQTVAFDWPLQRTLSIPVVLLGMHPLHPDEARGMTLRYGVRADGSGMVEGRPGWRLAAWHSHPLSNFVIPAHRRAILVIGASSRQCGTHHIHGLVVDYRIGVVRFSAPQQFGFDFHVECR